MGRYNNLEFQISCFAVLHHFLYVCMMYVDVCDYTAALEAPKAQPYPTPSAAPHWTWLAGLVAALTNQAAAWQRPKTGHAWILLGRVLFLGPVLTGRELAFDDLPAFHPPLSAISLNPLRIESRQHAGRLDFRLPIFAT